MQPDILSRRHDKMKIHLLILHILLLSLLTTYGYSADKGGNLSIFIPKSINISKQELSDILYCHHIAIPRGISIKITVFYYSESVETISYSEEKGMTMDRTDGSIQALVKIKKHDRLRKALVIQGKGNTKKAILTDFTRNLIQKL